MKKMIFKKLHLCSLVALMAMPPCAALAQQNVDDAINYYVSTSEMTIVNPVVSTKKDVKTGKLTSLYAEYSIDMKKGKGEKFVEKMRKAFQADATNANCYNTLSLTAGRTNVEKIRVAYGENMEKSIYFGLHRDHNYLVLLTKDPSDTLRRYCHAMMWYKDGSRIKGSLYKIYSLDPANKNVNEYGVFGKNLNFNFDEFNERMKKAGKSLERFKDFKQNELFDGDLDSLDLLNTHRIVTKKDENGNVVKVIEYEPNGKTTTVALNADGTKCVTVSDATGAYHTNGYKSNGDSVSLKSNADGSYSKYVKSKNGATTFYKYNSDGSYVKDDRRADGSRLYMKYNSDGSYVKDERKTDGSQLYMKYNSDASYVKNDRRADGSRLYIKYNSDGSYMKEEKNADGSSLVKRKNSDGSYFEEEKDKNGRVVYTKKKPYASRENDNESLSGHDVFSYETVG